MRSEQRSAGYTAVNVRNEQTSVQYTALNTASCVWRASCQEGFNFRGVSFCVCLVVCVCCVCVCGLWVWGVCMCGVCGCGVCVCVYEDPHAKRVLIFEGFPFVCVVSGCVFVDVVCVCCVCVICVCVGMWCVCVRAPGCRGGFRKSWHPTVITDAEAREDYRPICKPNCECASNIHMLCAVQNARQIRLSECWSLVGYYCLSLFN